MKLETVPLNRIAQMTPIIRAYRDEDWLNFLTEDVKKHGIQSPPHLIKKGEYYSPIDGWHRVQAAKKAGLTEIQAFVYDENEVDPFILGFRLNLMQQNLDPISIAHAIRELIYTYHKTWKEIEHLTGFSERHCRDFLQLLSLPEKEQMEIAAGNKPAFGKEARKRLNRDFPVGDRKQPLYQVRCPVCGAFPEKGMGKWIYFCKNHEEEVDWVLGLYLSGEYKRR